MSEEELPQIGPDSEEYWELYKAKMEDALYLRNFLLEMEGLCAEQGDKSGVMMASALGEILDAFPFGTDPHITVYNIINDQMNETAAGTPKRSEAFQSQVAALWHPSMREEMKKEEQKRKWWQR